MSRPMPHPGSNYLRGTLLGLTAGLLAAAVALHRGWVVLFSSLDATGELAASSVEPVTALRAWIDTNLGASWIPFGILAVMYVASLTSARRRLGAAEQTATSLGPSVGLLQLWSSTFFGIGVLWTAIGMRSALLHSLGGLGPAGAADTNAFELMSRLIDGGVLTALTTTIVGGAGSYVMNVLTQLYVVLPAQRLAAHLRANEATRLHQTLERIAAARSLTTSSESED